MRNQDSIRSRGATRSFACAVVGLALTLGAVTTSLAAHYDFALRDATVTALLEAGLHAALADTVMQGNLQQNRESAELSALLLQATTGSRLAHVFLTSSGAMARLRSPRPRSRS